MPTPIKGNANDSFLRFNDQDGNKLVSLNKDGSISTTGVGFPDGSFQGTAAGAGGVTSVFGRTGDVVAVGNDYGHITTDSFFGFGDGTLGLTVHVSVDPGRVDLTAGSGSLIFDPTLADFSLISTGAVTLITDIGGTTLTIGGLTVFTGNTATFVKVITPSLSVTGLQVHANNAAAITAGLVAGDFYRTGADPDLVAVVH